MDHVGEERGEGCGMKRERVGRRGRQEREGGRGGEEEVTRRRGDWSEGTSSGERKVPHATMSKPFHITTVSQNTVSYRFLLQASATDRFMPFLYASLGNRPFHTVS